MNGTIAKYFKSPKGEEGGVKRAEDSTVKVEEVVPVDDPEPGPSTATKPSKSDVDRLIAENMASVLKSLKKKRSHRCSKRKRNEEHRERGETAPAEDEGSDSSRNRSPQKEPAVPAEPPEDLPGQDPPKEEPSSNKENKKVNAFQLMMASRNKAIGSNSPGRDTNPDSPVPDPVEVQKKDEKVKRKLKLEEWADRKGAGKRKLQEEAQEEFIEHQMNRRAKRLKKLIKNMEVEEDEEPEPAPVLRESPRKSSRKSKEPPKPPPVVPLKVTAKRGRRRLSSDDSRPSSTATPEQSPVKKSANDGGDDDDGFTAKLNSPLKKKDSLLGYFAKVGGKSPEEATPVTTPTETSSKRGRPRRQPAAAAASTVSAPTPPSPLPPEEEQELILNPIIVEELSEDVPETPVSSITGSAGRPRRSCAGKIKDYAVFGGTSPDKEATTASGRRGGKKPIVTPLKIINVGSPSAMQVVRSPSVSRRLSGDWSEAPGTPRTSKVNGSVKLAPLFVKKVAEDPEKVKARQEFLRSGIPEKMRLEIEKQRCYEESILNESPVFPLVSHVQQLDRGEGVVDLKGCRVRILPETSPGKGGALLSKEDEFEFATLTSCDDDQVEGLLARLVDVGGDDVFRYELPEIADVKSIVREWKQVYKHFPVFKCYKQFRATFVEHCDEPAMPGREVQLEDSIELIEPRFSHANGELLFTEKYKPAKLDDILINCQPAITLKKFLSSWKEDRSQGNPYDSGDDFELSNSSSTSSSAICNHIVLVGPPGCGKTSNVYAVANDMNFNVLELNASSRRKGKIILQELQEATQSHQVRRKEADSGVDIFKKALARKGSKTKLRKASTDSEPSSKKLSLILIEDADIVFDQDDGFVTAMNQLISTSKRPIVLTTTDPNCPHLTRYISNNVIRYVAPGIGHVAKLLSILAIVEKVHIDQSDLARLYALNHKDLRKTINELQFFIQSGGDRNLPLPEPLLQEPALNLREASSTPTFDHDETSNQSEPLAAANPTRRHRSLFRLFSRNQNDPQQLIRCPLNLDNLWCNMERVLRTPPPVTTATTPKRTKQKKKKEAAKKQPGDDLEELVFFYENISAAALIQRDVKAGVRDRLVDHLEEDVAHELVEASWERWFEGKLEEQQKGKRRSGVGAMCYDSLKQFDQEGRQTISAYIGLGGPIRTRATYCDCEPLLRAICRTERERSRVERRGSRFYHYFRNYVGIGGGGSSIVAPPSSFSVDHFDELSTRFEEDLGQVTTATAKKVPAESESDESR